MGSGGGIVSGREGGVNTYGSIDVTARPPLTTYPKDTLSQEGLGLLTLAIDAAEAVGVVVTDARVWEGKLEQDRQRLERIKGGYHIPSETTTSPQIAQNIHIYASYPSPHHIPPIISLSSHCHLFTTSLRRRNQTPSSSARHPYKKHHHRRKPRE